MKENIVSSDSRLVQVFLSQQQTPGPGIYEVSVEKDSDSLSCTCPGFRGRATCKHVRFVKARIDNNKGNYPLEISSRATKDDAEKARQSNIDFREFVIKFGKIEVF
jgi:hypothetical protein